MDNNRLIKTVIFAIVEGKSKVGRLKRKPRDNLIELSSVSFYALTKIAKD